MATHGDRTKVKLTFPKTTCLPSSHGVFTVVMKNCDPLRWEKQYGEENKIEAKTSARQLMGLLAKRRKV